MMKRRKKSLGESDDITVKLSGSADDLTANVFAVFFILQVAPRYRFTDSATLSAVKVPKDFSFIQQNKTKRNETGPYLLILLLVLVLLLSSYSNLICLITPQQPPASFTPDVTQSD